MATGCNSKGCGCKRDGGKPCSAAFSREQFEYSRMQCAELSRAELDMAILGQLAALLISTPQTSGHRPSNQRHRTKMAFHFNGKPTCRDTFLVLHGIGKRIDQIWSLSQYSNLSAFIGSQEQVALKTFSNKKEQLVKWQQTVPAKYSPNWVLRSVLRNNTPTAQRRCQGSAIQSFSYYLYLGGTQSGAMQSKQHQKSNCKRSCKVYAGLWSLIWVPSAKQKVVEKTKKKLQGRPSKENIYDVTRHIHNYSTSHHLTNHNIQWARNNSTVPNLCRYSLSAKRTIMWVIGMLSVLL